MNSLLRKSASLLALGAALALTGTAHAVSFTYSSENNSFIVFDGASNFEFTPAVNNFKVTSGSAAGALGEITGTYTIGAISVFGPVKTAPVSGVGAFTIHDGSGFDLTGTLSWVNITQNGTGGNLNTVGNVNLTGVTYGGSNADLVALKNNTTAYNTLSFSFVPAVDLENLKNGPGSNSTSFSGTVTSNVPEGGLSLVMLGLALSSLAVVRRKFLA
jgi:hypothetical protein